MNKYLYICALTLAAASTLTSCKKDDEEEKEDNKDLYCEIGKSGYTYYAGTQQIVEGLGGAHGFIKVRFNSIAAAALDSTGQLPVGGSFPEGSVIVKESYSSASGGLNLYAVMKKSPGNKNSGSGWIWGEYKQGGDVVFSAAKKGNGCISCHSSGDQRDLVRTFDLH
jgi:hypothetical protein